MRIIVTLLLCCAVRVYSKKKSEYTQKDWDRIAREWEREEMEEDERERQEELNKPGAGFQFDPSGKIDPEKLMAQSKKGKPTMVFFNVLKEFSPSQKELTVLTKKWSSLLLNGNVPVQNFPVSDNRAIFMVQDGSLSYEVKNFLVQQPEIESVTIDQQIWHAGGDGKPSIVGQDEVLKKKQKTKKKSEEDNSSEEKKSVPKEEKKMKKEEKQRKSKIEVHNTINFDDEMSDEEIHEKFFKDSDAKGPKPVVEVTENVVEVAKPVVEVAENVVEVTENVVEVTENVVENNDRPSVASRGVTDNDIKLKTEL